MIAYVFPGQGSQVKGMGEGLFDEFSSYTELASNILGYSVKDLCLNDTDMNLGKTQYTQPMLYIVESLMYLKKKSEDNIRPDFVAGHSLGEYAALFAAGVVDFETGLRLVQKRGELMSRAVSGSMAAIIGLQPEEILRVCHENNFDELTVANYNSPSQTVISGSKQQIDDAEKIFSEIEYTRYVKLKVSGAFHSPYMADASRQFSEFVEHFNYNAPQIPVFSNYTGVLYTNNNIKENLVKQITNSVRWTDIVRYMMGEGVDEFIELGPGKVLKGLINNIKKNCEPMKLPITDDKCLVPKNTCDNNLQKEFHLGSEEFRKEYNVKYSYIQGAMYNGISSSDMVIAMGKAGLLGIFGTGGLSIDIVELELRKIKDSLCNNESFGMNLLFNSDYTEKEEKMVDLFIKENVSVIECSAYIYITPAIVRYRLMGVKRAENGVVYSTNRIIAKLSRPEVAEAFMSPPPDDIVENLLFENVISTEQAKLAKEISMADDICAESDSAGHTDQAVALSLIPSICSLRNRLQKKYNYTKQVRVGAGGGIGTGDAALACFALGAEFITTGSINQCTVEAGISDIVKDMLQEIDVQDTQYAPAGDLFELGAKVQVLKKGVFFPARANKLYELYKQLGSIDEIDDKTKKQLEEKYFKMSLSEVYDKIKAYYSTSVIDKAESNPKYKMALIFKYYFALATKSAKYGEIDNKVNFQVHCGPALGAFNSQVKGTELEDWHNRYVDKIAEVIMNDAESKYKAFLNIKSM